MDRQTERRAEDVLLKPNISAFAERSFKASTASRGRRQDTSIAKAQQHLP